MLVLGAQWTAEERGKDQDMAGWHGMALPSASLSFLKTLDVHFVHTQRRGTGSAPCPPPPFFVPRVHLWFCHLSSVPTCHRCVWV